MTVAGTECDGGCPFCGGDHPTESDKTYFMGLPIAVCPNIPTGWVMVEDRIIVVIDCERCDGSGYLDDLDVGDRMGPICPDCGGSGSKAKG